MPAALRRRRRAPSSGPWAQKKTPTAVDAFALNENENVRAFPALIMPVPVDIRGFSSTSPASPGLSRFLNYSVPLQPIAALVGAGEGRTQRSAPTELHEKCVVLASSEVRTTLQFPRYRAERQNAHQSIERI